MNLRLFLPTPNIIDAHVVQTVREILNHHAANYTASTPTVLDVCFLVSPQERSALINRIFEEMIRLMPRGYVSITNAADEGA